MKFFLLVVALATVCYARPGGYTAKGGVYDFLKELDYMDQAVAAGKFAWGKHVEEELIQEEAFRNARSNEDYTPTYFTTQNNYDALANSRLNDGLFFDESLPQFRSSRGSTAQQRPLYYSSYLEKHAGY